MRDNKQRVVMYLRNLRRQVPGRAVVAGLIIAVGGIIGLRLSLAEVLDPPGLPPADEPSAVLAAAKAENKVIVKYKPAVAEAAADSSVARVEADEVKEIEQLDIKVLQTEEGKQQQVIDQLNQDPNVEFAEAVGIARAELTRPDDPYMANQWSLKTTLVDLLWDKHKGSDQVVVAVVDTGVPAGHEDMDQGRYVAARDFLNADNDPADDNGHGSMVAGIIAATTNNGMGVAGICWSCRIMPLKALDAEGAGDTASILEAIHYAADNGADIINMSFGGYGEYEAINQAIQYAASKGAVVVTSAGNSNTDDLHWPSMYEPAISVAGTRPDDSKHPDSNFGSTVDIATPYSVTSTDIGGGYRGGGGTSYASPTVAGVLAVLKAAFPNATPAQLRNAITSTADPCCGGVVPNGRINAIKAYNLLAGSQNADTTKPAMKITAPAQGATVSGQTVLLTGVASDNVSVAKVHIQIDGGPPGLDSDPGYTQDIDVTSLTDGPHTITMTAYDAAGNSTTVSHGFIVNNATPDTTKPTAAITAPAEGATVSGADLQVQVDTADANGIAEVQLWHNDTYVSTDYEAPFMFTQDTTKLSDGNHKLSIRALDASGNEATAIRNYLIRNSTTTPKPEDLNGDGSVNLTDLSMLLSNWNKNTAIADINNSGKVDLTDLSMLLSKWGT